MESHLSGRTVIAPGASITSTSMQRALAVALDLFLAMALVLAVPFAFAVLAALLELLIKIVHAAVT